MRNCRDDKRYHTELVFNNDSPIELPDGKRIGRLIIKDPHMGKLSITFRQNNLDSFENYICDSKLELLAFSEDVNEYNLSVGQYFDRIQEVFEYLKKDYGVEADYESVRIKRLEINANIYLEEPYQNYEKAIMLLIRNISPKKFGKCKGNDSVKYATWHESSIAHQTDRLETVVVKNSSLELKIYNKGKQLVDTGRYEELPEKDIMRIEYTLKDSRLLTKDFKSALAFDLTDAGINQLFKRYWRAHIETRYYQWKSQNLKDLETVISRQKANNPRWVKNFLLETREFEAQNGMPLLFDISDVYTVLKRIEPKSGRNAAQKFKRFKAQCKYETDRIGNTKRIQEIFDKVNRL